MSDDMTIPKRAETGAETDAERPPAQERLYAVTAERIVAYIAASGLERGDRLPSEKELSEMLAVSRPTIREAVVALEVAGALELRRNVGAVIRRAGARLPRRLTETEPGPFELLDIRQQLEPWAARLAAEHATPEHCAAMEAAIERMASETRAGVTTEYGDRDFHLEIARASGNSALPEIISTLWAARTEGMLWQQLERQTDISGERTRAVFDHMRILAAIREKDGEKAEKAMRAHLALAQAICDRFL